MFYCVTNLDVVLNILRKYKSVVDRLHNRITKLENLYYQILRISRKHGCGRGGAKLSREVLQNL